MKEKPILFSGAMVKAIIQGRKTQTRRLVHLETQSNDVTFTRMQEYPDGSLRAVFGYDGEPNKFSVKCPYKPGDRLWVRETSRCGGWDPAGDYELFSVGYEADGTYQSRRVAITGNASPYKDHRKATPAIHMPRWASRITLEITGVRVERLQDISEEDAVAEGIEKRDNPWNELFWKAYHSVPNPSGDGEIIGFASPKRSFQTLWESINGPGSWDANQWVRVIEFKRVKQIK